MHSIGMGLNSGRIIRNNSYSFLFLLHFSPFAHKKSFKAVTQHFNTSNVFQPWIAKNVNNFTNKWKTVVTGLTFNSDTSLFYTK